MLLLMVFGSIKTAAENTYVEVEPPHAQAAVVEQQNNEPIETPTPTPPPAPTPKQKARTTGINLKSNTKADPEKLKAYLVSIGSPLANYSDQIAQSEFWSLLIGICHIEQYGCTKAPNTSPYNFWGMMQSGHIRKFASQEEAIAYMDNYFIQLYPKRPTIESLRGYYCASACTNWEPTVKKIKALVESL